MRVRHVGDDNTSESLVQETCEIDVDGLDLDQGSGKPAGQRATGPLAAGFRPPPYLESIPKDCNRPNPAVLEAFPCKCKSWFCAACCVGRGLQIRNRLLEALKTFTGLQMWTLTVDPSLFEKPLLAYRHLREQRCVARLIKGLKSREKLHTARYFYAVEWQRESEMPHFHVLLDATYIPFDLACSIWNGFRPLAAGPVEGDRPGFGAIRFSAAKHCFKSPEHAARYACKYLIKHPEHGYPSWVMNHSGQIHRYGISHQFWKLAKPVGSGEFVDTKAKSAFSGQSDFVAGAGKRKRKRVATKSTIQERIAKCGESSVVLSVQAPSNAKEKWEFTFIQKIGQSVANIAALLGKSLEGGKLVVSLQELQSLRVFRFKKEQES